MVGICGICAEAGIACGCPGSAPTSGMGIVCGTPPFVRPPVILANAPDARGCGGGTLPSRPLLSGVLLPGYGSDSAGGSALSPVSMRASWPAEHSGANEAKTRSALTRAALGYTPGSSCKRGDCCTSIFFSEAVYTGSVLAVAESPADVPAKFCPSRAPISRFST